MFCHVCCGQVNQFSDASPLHRQLQLTMVQECALRLIMHEYVQSPPFSMTLFTYLNQQQQIVSSFNGSTDETLES